MRLDKFRELLGGMEVGLESVDRKNPDYIVNIRFMDILICFAAVVILMSI